jgi:CheY-like chemotaxis protein/HPt (histidine-containing phosphotransfer) domain-containing protein
MKRILIVDDDTFVTSVYCNKFRSEGFDAEITSSGIAAIQMVKKEAWDLVVLDLQLPDLNGVEVLKAIRTEFSAKKLPVIVFSNAFLGILVEAAWKAGANQLLTKAQCTPNQLVSTARNVLGVAPPPPSGIKRVSIAEMKVARSTRKQADSHDQPQIKGEKEDPQSELRRRFHDETPQVVAALRERLKAFLSGGGEPAQQESLQLLCRTVHALIGSAGVAGYGRVAQMASAMEALFQELRDQPRIINISTLRTIVHGVDSLIALCNSSNGDATYTPLPPLALVVDDDDVSGHAVRSALEKVHVRSVVVNDPLVALSLCKWNRFELILLDVDMPGMDGVTLCTKIRSLPDRETTRVIFVTALTNFKAVARDVLRDDDEVIAKPFTAIELAVKALTYLLAQPDQSHPQSVLEK